MRVLLVAKHVFSAGELHAEDGNHATYHRQMREMLEGMGLNLSLADSYRTLFEDPGTDFVFPLLNRGGFLNSEMLLPLLCTRLGIPFLGASPILRGMSDDKHLAKLEAQAHGLATLPWAIYRRGAPVLPAICPMAERMVVKPNASSASWGVRDADDWAGVKAGIEAIQDEGHDAIVEPFMVGHDIEVSTILSDGAPTLLPMMMNRQDDPARLRSYAEKRALTDDGGHYEGILFDDPAWTATIAEQTLRFAPAFHPYDYGRFEFRLNPDTGELVFLEINLNCNLWSEKTFGWCAAQLDWDHRDMIETILAESLYRHGVIVDIERGEG